MRELLELSPGEFCAAAVEVLAGEDSERVKRYLVALLWTNNLLIPCLTNPATPPKKAESIAALARRVDPQLPAKLVGFVLERTDLEPPECLERILGLLRSMPDAAGFRPLLTPLLRHPNARIRSKVALLAGEGNRNRTWFERRMLEDDPRVRANAIESAGTGVVEDLRPLFHAAAADSNNRVVGNALIALYRLGDPAAIANLYELASRPDPAFRSTAVWAMGETGDTRFLPVLAKILTDPSETIKAATFRAIRKLRGRDGAGGRAMAVRILSEPYLSGSALKFVFGVSYQDRAVRKIAATAVRILVNGEFIYRYSIAEQECCRRISAAFLVPRTADLRSDQKESHRAALERCFEHRNTGDAWILSRYSASAGDRSSRPETLFGVRIDSVETSSFRPVANSPELRAALDVRDAVRSPEFSNGLLGLCQELRPSRVSAHLFLLHPETAQPVDPVSLTRAAQDAHVSVHAVCSSPDPGIGQICRDTGGFYIVGEDTPEALSAIYRGISHRYHATLAPDVEVRRIQVAVRLADSFGESPWVDVNDSNAGPETLKTS